MADTKTRLELIYQALDNLGVLVQGQAPGAETVERMDGLVDPMLATLAALEVTFVGDPGTASPPTGGAIEPEVFLPLAAILAQRAAGAFNMAGDASLMALAQLAEGDLRTIARPARTRKLLTTDTQLRAGNRRAVFNYTTGR